MNLVEILLDRFDGWLMAQHDPDRVDDDVWCVGHRGTPVLWPCKEWTEAAERRQLRKETQADG